jgi:hypothetical protein
MTTFLSWYGREAAPGEEIDLPDRVAKAYVDSGQAEYVPQIETAIIAPAENAALRTKGKNNVRIQTAGRQ